MKPIKPIKTDADYQEALAETERLAVKNPASGTRDADRLEILATLAEVYEKNQFPIDKPSPAEAIEFRVEQLGLKRKDLEQYIGSKSRVSEVLSGKRTLTLHMIRALSKGLDIPADVLLQEPPRALPPDLEIQWSKFPIAEMAGLGWIDVDEGDIDGGEEELMRPFFAPVEQIDLGCVQYRKSELSARSGRRMNPYALVAWSAQILLRAQRKAITKYIPRTVNAKFMRNVARCSWAENGPLLAQEYLENHGIHLVVEQHLRRTYLDGSSCLMVKSGAPVIGMTLRHDRLDNFWFVLLHELAHISKHLDVKAGRSASFFDDLDSEAGDSKEEEADQLAKDALIPPKEWEDFTASPVDPGRIAEFASSLTIHPAIVAGRYRHEARDYRRFSRMVGRHKVRMLFGRHSDGIV